MNILTILHEHKLKNMISKMIWDVKKSFENINI